jgi:hypothetical protein
MARFAQLSNYKPISTAEAERIMRGEESQVRLPSNPDTGSGPVPVESNTGQELCECGHIKDAHYSNGSGSCWRCSCQQFKPATRKEDEQPPAPVSVKNGLPEVGVGVRLPSGSSVEVMPSKTIHGYVFSFGKSEGTAFITTQIKLGYEATVALRDILTGKITPPPTPQPDEDAEFGEWAIHYKQTKEEPSNAKREAVLDFIKWQARRRLGE